MKRILISGYHGFGNCGDEAILVAMIKNLKESNPDIEIVALSKKPQETEKNYGVKSISRVNIFRIFHELLHSNLLISGGGSLLQDVTSTRSLIYYLSIITLAKLMGKTVMIYANGIGPIKKKCNRILTKFIINKVNLITLRDEDSKNELARLGVTKPKIMVTADPVFTFEIHKDVDNTETLDRYKIPHDKPIVGISIRKWKIASKYEEKIARIADSIIEKNNYNVLFIPMQMPNDLSVIYKVQDLMKNKSYTINDKIKIQDYVTIIGSLTTLISMRLHTLIFAAVRSIPMIGIVYDPKIQSFLDMIEQPSAGDISSIDEDNLLKIIDETIKNRDEIREKLGEHVKVLKEKAQLNDKKVMELLNK
jgi:polysaccharide pyruvyl transferase CsaB